ncbi:hypothetical protein G210_4742, partial [Candida maltosa Xu316]
QRRQQGDVLLIAIITKQVIVSQNFLQFVIIKIKICNFLIAWVSVMKFSALPDAPLFFILAMNDNVVDNGLSNVNLKNTKKSSANRVTRNQKWMPFSGCKKTLKKRQTLIIKNYLI